MNTLQRVINSVIKRGVSELGDVLVTTVLLADLLGTTIEERLHLAYEKISKRTGKTINGRPK